MITLFPNRWFIWAIVIMVVAGMLLWWAVELYAIEQEFSYGPDVIEYTIRVQRRASPEKAACEARGGSWRPDTAVCSTPAAS
ncbi:MAG: hypothetical protein HYT34_00090 [Candidatus Ryanbacteria bacterium]|nr:hypothetical protein [Candidatus Ryanbacteria bacterium]